MFGKIHYYESIDSTNDEVKRLAEQGAPSGTVVIAGQQTGGKGRRGCQWISPSGENIYMSFLLRPDFAPTMASMITLVCAMAVRKALEKHGLSPMIKWPNDIILSGKKTCGILTEMSMQADKIQYIVVGIGINVHQEVFDEGIRDVATSLVLENQKDYDHMQIVADVLEAFEGYYDLFVQRGNLQLLKEEYNQYLVNINRDIRIIEPGGTKMGVARGIDDDGCLIAEINGNTEHIMSGEVSVRGVLGYV